MTRKDFAARISANRQAIGALLVAAVAGWTAAMFFGGFTKLPAQVKANTKAVADVQRSDEQQSRDIQAMRRDLAFVRCWIVQPEGADALSKLERCER